MARTYKVINWFTRYTYTFRDTPYGRVDHKGRIPGSWDETFNDMLRLGETRHIEPEYEFIIVGE